MQPWNIRQLNINKCLTLKFFLFFFHILTLLQCFLNVCISIYVYNIAVIFRLKSFRSVAIPLSHFFFFSLLLLFLCLASWSVLEGIIEWLHVCTCTWRFLCVAYSFDVSFLCSSFFSLNFRGSWRSRILMECL